MFLVEWCFADNPIIYSTTTDDENVAHASARIALGFGAAYAVVSGPY